MIVNVEDMRHTTGKKKQKLTDKNQFKNQPIFIFFLKKTT